MSDQEKVPLSLTLSKRNKHKQKKPQLTELTYLIIKSNEREIADNASPDIALKEKKPSSRNTEIFSLVSGLAGDLQKGKKKGGKHSEKEMASTKESSSEGSNIKGVPTHGGKYVQYNVYGNLFEVSSKYVPPIRPIGRGAYGIVW